MPEGEEEGGGRERQQGLAPDECEQPKQTKQGSKDYPRIEMRIRPENTHASRNKETG